MQQGDLRALFAAAIAARDARVQQAPRTCILGDLCVWGGPGGHVHVNETLHKCADGYVCEGCVARYQWAATEPSGEMAPPTPRTWQRRWQ